MREKNQIKLDWKMIRPTIRRKMAPVSGYDAAAWKCSAQILVPYARHIKKDMLDYIESLGKKLVNATLGYVAMQIRALYYIDDKEKHDRTVELQNGHREEAQNKALEIKALGCNIISLIVHRPIAPEADEYIDNELVNIMVWNPKEAWHYLAEKIRVTRRQTNIQEWRNALDWVIRQMSNLEKLPGQFK